MCTSHDRSNGELNFDWSEIWLWILDVGSSDVFSMDSDELIPWTFTPHGRIEKHI